MSALFPLLIELVKAAPSFIATGREIVDGAKQLWATASAEQNPSEDQQAEFDAVLADIEAQIEKS